MAGIKSNKIKLNNNVREVMELLIDGYGRSEILQYIAENHGKSERQTDDYIRKARDVIKERYTKTEEEMVRDAAASYDKIKRQATKANKLQTALNAEKAKAELFGTNAPRKISHAIETSYVDLEAMQREFDKKNK